MKKDIKDIKDKLFTEFKGKLIINDYTKIDDGISFGFPSINWMCTGNISVGIPYGTICQLYGPAGGGKSTLALHAVAQEQKKGNPCAYVDVECSLTQERAAKLGVDTNNLLHVKPHTAELSFSVIEKLAASKVKLIVLDSLAHLVPNSIYEADYDKMQVSPLARFLSASVPKIASKLSHFKCSFIVINQVRVDLKQTYGNPEKTPGGKIITHAASLNIRCSSSISSLKQTWGPSEGIDITGTKEIPVATITSFKTQKNRFYSPFRTAEAILNYTEGFSIGYDCFKMAERIGLAKRTKGGYQYAGSFIKDKDLEKKVHAVSLDLLNFDWDKWEKSLNDTDNTVTT